MARAVIWTVGAIPRKVAVSLVRALAVLCYYLDTRHRHIARVNLRIAFPEKSARARSAIARRSFQNTAMNLVEVSRISRLSSQNVSELVQYDPDAGLNNFVAARSRKKGIIYLTGHFSSWELLPIAHALYGHPLSFVTRPLDNDLLDLYFESLRESKGNRVIPKKDAARTILKVLKENGTVGILMDQNTSLMEGTFADLFGVPAATTTGIALLALRTGSPILPGYLTPMRNGRYTIKFLPPVEVTRTGDRALDIETNTRRLNAIVEDIVREQPDSWLWGHKRWKYQPPGNPQDLYSLTGKDLDLFLKSLAGTETQG
jgi:KDO2-lipid IV(A) lauroyltransferase